MMIWLGSIGSIIFIDLVLSSDNALVIGAAAARLPRRSRLMAITIGGAFAILFRILFASLASVLLQRPLLGIIGGVIVLFIAIRLLIDRSKARPRQADEQSDEIQRSQITGSQPLRNTSTRRRQFLFSIFTILIADVTMSLDNVLSVGALAQGNLLILAAGLIPSVLLLLAGSALVSELVGRLPWLLDVACLVLAWTASQLLAGDDSLQNIVYGSLPWLQFLIPALALLIVIVADLFLRYRANRKHRV